MVSQSYYTQDQVTGALSGGTGLIIHTFVSHSRRYHAKPYPLARRDICFCVPFPC